LAENRLFKELRLSGNDDMGGVVSYIADVTEEGKAVKFPPIVRLDIAGSDLSSGDVKKLIKIINRPTIHITSIDVSGSKLRGDMAKIFDILLAMEKTQNSVLQLKVNDCQIADSAVTNMKNYISSTTKLTTFKVGYNTTLFKKGNYSFISEMIRANTTLKNLDLSGMNFTSEQVTPIFDAILNHPTLVKLTFDANPVGQYLNKIAELLMMCQHLVVLRLRNLENVSKEELVNWLNNSLPDTMSVEKICLQGNGLTSEDISKAMDSHPTVHFEI